MKYKEKVKEKIKEKMSFIPKERGSLPRVLLLDFDDNVFQSVQQAGLKDFLKDNFKKFQQ